MDGQADHSGAHKHIFHVLHLSFSMLGVFIAYKYSRRFGRLGYWSIATIYIAFSFSALIIGPTVVSYLKPKFSLFVGALCYTSFVIANLWPSTWTLIPTAALLGVGASILWTAEGNYCDENLILFPGTYLTTAAANYSYMLQREKSSSMGLFNGIFFATFQINQVVGNLIAGFILAKTATVDPQSSEYTTLMKTYIGIAGVATLSMLFLSNEEPMHTKYQQLNSDPGTEKQEVAVETPSIFNKIFQALILLKDPRCLLLIPVLFYSGMEQAFIFGNFTKDIVSRAIGSGQIGFVMAAFGGFDVIFSFIFGKIADRVGAGYLVFCGFVCHSLFLCLMLVVIRLESVFWFTDKPILLYVAAIVWAIGDAVWNTFPNTILGIYFTENKEAAFANLKFWQSVGAAVPFIVGSYMRLDLKLACVLGFQIFAVMGIVFLQQFISPLSSVSKKRSDNS